MSDSKIQRNFAIVGLLSIIIIVLCTQIILNLETNSESLTEDGIFIVPLLFLIICLILILTIIYQRGPFNEGKLELTRDDFSLLLLLISMFIIGFILGPSISLPSFFTNSDIIGIFILLMPILMIFLLLSNFRSNSKENISVNNHEEE
ncbi:MAG: hypothetical protein CMO38_07495 [Verrucomicrobiaceae bacterium]|nr:hypothetical protein [Verrucomicrobiaceae bacterium]MBD29074.1 hypothetical protein [Verrucomicrobiaceae bacterium]|tara:strand:- start:175 stop:618 length:444 start_codon:yes stop_codon:yes gene_type:complete